MAELWVEDVEYHSVNLTKRYELDEEDVIAEFGSVENFQELFDNGDDGAQSYVYDGDYETDEDWWTANKGGFEIDTTTSWEGE
jgi:hypothetical protein